MPLKSQLFEGNERLNACLVKDAAHVVPGEVGPHVADIQLALKIIDGLRSTRPNARPGPMVPARRSRCSPTRRNARSSIPRIRPPLTTLSAR